MPAGRHSCPQFVEVFELVEIICNSVVRGCSLVQIKKARSESKSGS